MLIVSGPKPSGATAAQWVRQKADLPARVHAALGLIHFNRKDYASSIEEYEKATSLARGRECRLLPDGDRLLLSGAGCQPGAG